MPVGGQNTEITLENQADTLKVGLKLAYNPETGQPMFESGLRPAIPPRISQDVSTYAQHDPEDELTWEMRSWHRGFGQYAVDPLDPHKYAWADGVDARFPGELSLGMAIANKGNKLDVELRNPGAEYGDTTGWTAGTGVTYTVTTGAAKNGSYGHQIVTDGSRSNNDLLLYQDFVYPTVHRGGSMLFMAWLKRTSGSDSGIKMGIYDGVSSITYSTAVTASDYTFEDFFHTRHASTSVMRVGFYLNTNETGAHTFQIDDIDIQLLNVLERSVGSQEFEGNLYHAQENSIYKFNATTQLFSAVEWQSTGFTSLKSFNGTLYAGRGDGTAGRLTTDGTTWSADSVNRYFHARGRNQNGNWALHGAIQDGANQGLYILPQGGAWGSKISVGDPDRKITGLHEYLGVILVGREDGLFLYNEVFNRYDDLEPELNSAPSIENYDKGLARAGWLYLSAAEHSFWRFRLPNIFEDMSDLVEAPSFDELGGRIRAFAQDKRNLYVVLETPVADTTNTKVHYLISLSENRRSDGSLEWHSHTLHRFTMSNVYSAIKDGSTLFVFGRKYESNIDGTLSGSKYLSAYYGFVLPTQGSAPYKAATPDLVTSGKIITPWMDWNYPDIEKGFSKLTILSKSLSSDLTVTAYYQVDNAADSNDTDDWTSLGSFTTSPVQSRSFAADTTGKRIRLLLAFATNSSATTPVITAIVLKAVWNPTRLQWWKATVLVEDDVSTAPGVRIGTTAAKLATDLDTLRKEPWVTFVDTYGTEHNAKIKDLQHVYVSNTSPRPGVPEYSRAITLDMVEVITS